MPSATNRKTPKGDGQTPLHMLLTLLALAGALLVVEETFSRLLRRGWQTGRWFVLPPVGLLVAYQIPLELFSYPLIMDLYASILLGLAAGALVGVHGTFRDGHWRPGGTTQKTATRHPVHTPRTTGRLVPAPKATTSQAATARAPLRTRP